MGMKAFEAAAPRRPADSDGKFRPQPSLFPGRLSQARLQQPVVLRGFRPSFDRTRGLETRDGRDEVRARQPEGCRERVAVLVVRRLLGDGGPTEGTADSYAPKCARRTPELPFDPDTISHHRRR